MPQILETLDDVLQAMAPYAGGSVPPTTDSEYDNWVSWINQGQEDAAQRGFWSRLLTKGTLSITNGVASATLPTDFYKRNGIYILDVGGSDWADPSNSEGQKLVVNLNSITGDWQVLFNGFTPTSTVTATMWYFFQPPKLVNPSDKLYLDGKMVLYYALTEYNRVSGELGSLDDARAEYNNRFSELLALDQLPAKNELMSWRSLYQDKNVNVNEYTFYNRGRIRR